MTVYAARCPLMIRCSLSSTLVSPCPVKSSDVCRRKIKRSGKDSRELIRNEKGDLKFVWNICNEFNSKNMFIQHLGK